MTRVRAFIQRHRQVVMYLSFGTVTTVCSLLACFLTLRLGVKVLHDEGGEPTVLLDVLASTAQWLVGLIIAFITSKKYVFLDADSGPRVTLRQLEAFAGSRLLLYFLEVGVNLSVIALLEKISYETRVLLGIPMTERVWAKVASSAIMLFANYYVSKLLVFRKKGKSGKKKEKD